MSNLILLALMIGVFAYWAYSISKYDWSTFDEDQERAKKDLF